MTSASSGSTSPRAMAFRKSEQSWWQSGLRPSMSPLYSGTAQQRKALIRKLVKELRVMGPNEISRRVLVVATTQMGEVGKERELTQCDHLCKIADRLINLRDINSSLSVLLPDQEPSGRDTCSLSPLLSELFCH